jgi:hypothetical protein
MEKRAGDCGEESTQFFATKANHGTGREATGSGSLESSPPLVQPLSRILSPGARPGFVLGLEPIAAVAEDVWRERRAFLDYEHESIDRCNLVGRAGKSGNPLVRSPPRVLLLMTVLSPLPLYLISLLLYLEALCITLLGNSFSEFIVPRFSDLHSSTEIRSKGDIYSVTSLSLYTITLHSIPKRWLP